MFIVRCLVTVVALDKNWTAAEMREKFVEVKNQKKKLKENQEAAMMGKQVAAFKKKEVDDLKKKLNKRQNVLDKREEALGKRKAELDELKVQLENKQPEKVVWQGRNSSHCIRVRVKSRMKEEKSQKNLTRQQLEHHGNWSSCLLLILPVHRCRKIVVKLV